MKRAYLPAAIAACAIGALCAQAAVAGERYYQGNVLPSADGWSLYSAPYNNEGICSLVAGDSMASDGKALRVLTTVSAFVRWAYTALPIDPAIGATIVVRSKVIDTTPKWDVKICPDPDANFGISGSATEPLTNWMSHLRGYYKFPPSDPGYVPQEYCGLHDEDTYMIKWCTGKTRGASNYSWAGSQVWGNYHTLRMTLDTTSPATTHYWDFYVDEVFRGALVGAAPYAPSQGFNGFFFGAGEPLISSDEWIVDYVYVTNDGAFAPGQRSPDPSNPANYRGVPVGFMTDPTIAVNPAGTQLTFNFTTAAASDATVYYRLRDPNEGWPTPAFTAVSFPGLVTSHSVTLTGLTPDTMYDFYIKCTNGSGVSEFWPLPFGTRRNLPWATTATWTLGEDIDNPGFDTGALDPWYLYGYPDFVIYFTGQWSIPCRSWINFITTNIATPWGVYQTFATTPNKLYEFYVYATGYDWSKTKVGLDPTGGTNPSATSVVWGPEYTCLWSYFWNVVPRVAVKAIGSRMTAFIRSNNGQTAFDDAGLMRYDSALTSLGDGLLGADGTYVELTDYRVTYVVPNQGTPGMAKEFYIEAPDRSAGIWVRRSTVMTIAVGNKVTAKGFLSNLVNVKEAQAVPGPNAYLLPWTITVTGQNAPIAPVVLNNRAVGGGNCGLQAGPTGGSGTNTVNLLVTVYGRVTDDPKTGADALGNPYMSVYLDDGAGLPVAPGAASPTGIYCQIPYSGSPPDIAKGDYIGVTGVNLIELVTNASGSAYFNRVYGRSVNDIAFSFIGPS